MFKLLIYCALLTQAVFAVADGPVFAPSIDQCPKLNKRPKPSSVHDLRPDDIEVVAAIGDSISAGVAAINVDTPYLHKDQFKEYRGLSFDMGGDPGAITVPNFIQHYRSEPLIGPSKGVEQMPICDDTFFCLSATHNPETEHLNAAIPASTSKLFTEQANYLIQKLGPGTELGDKWKFITIYIGLNDLSVSCMPGFTVLDYFARMDQGLALLKKNIKNAYVNMRKFGMLHLEETIKVTDNEPEYRKYFENGDFDVQSKECYCCHFPAGPVLIKLNVELFNIQLRLLAGKYSSSSSSKDSNFTVVYQPFSPDSSKIPVHTLSNLDGFHPNVAGHQYFAKVYWNMLFMHNSEKPTRLEWDPDLQVRCPGENDRFLTN